MWKGYQFDEQGFLKTTVEGRMYIVKHSLALKLSEIENMKKVYEKEISNATVLWKNAKSNAQRIGEDLSYYECLEVLANNNVSENEIVNKPVTKYQAKMEKVTKISTSYDVLIDNINSAIDEQLQLDKKLAKQIGGK